MKRRAVASTHVAVVGGDEEDVASTLTSIVHCLDGLVGRTNRLYRSVKNTGMADLR